VFDIDKHINFTLSITFTSIKISFKKKLQTKKILVKEKTREVIFSLFLLLFTKSVYNIAIAKQVNKCLDRFIEMQVIEFAKNKAR